MKLLKTCLASALLLFTLSANAQVSALPTNADGDPVLPLVNTEVGLGAYVEAWWDNQSLPAVIWGEGGEDIEDFLDAAGIDITSYEGVLQYQIVFEISGRPISLTGLVQKLANETLEEMFEREFEIGNLPQIQENRLGTRLFTEIYFMEEAFAWMGNGANQGYAVGAHYFGGYNDGVINTARGVVTITDCDEVCGEIP